MSMPGINIDAIANKAPSPSYVVDLGRLRHNLALLGRVQEESGATVLMALKAFAMWKTFPLIRETLSGVCASSPWEARLGREEFGKEVHSFAAAFKEDDVRELLSLSDHMVFNSFEQLERFRPLWQHHQPHVSVGLRINPQHSEGHTALYDPCAPCSRLGITLDAFHGRSLEGVEGLHFHTLCEQMLEPLERTVAAVEKQFGEYLHGMRWLNLGGGHHITREGYDIEGLIRLIKRLRTTYGVDVYLEPGEAVIIGTGVLVSEVLDIVHNAMDIAILDVSATCHMPDVLEMPYRPEVTNGDFPGVHPHTYRLAGPSCLAGDVIGDWSFCQPLTVGQRLVFEDMSHYTMVKTTTFNGIQHPALCIYEPNDGTLEVVRHFGYSDFKARLS